MSLMFNLKFMIRSTFLLWLILSLAAYNSVTLLPTISYSNVYCDKFLIYGMCAEDIDNDRIAEHVYFADTLEVS